MERYLEAGLIVATHGVRGEIKVLPWADGPEFLLEFDHIYVNGKCYAVESGRVHKTCALLKLEGLDTIEAVTPLMQQVVKVDREEVELEEGYHFIADLIGLKVVSEGQIIGVLKEVLSLPGNDVYVVKGEHDYMIPVVKEFVEEPDFEAGTVTVHLIEGMRTDEN